MRTAIILWYRLHNWLSCDLAAWFWVSDKWQRGTKVVVIPEGKFFYDRN